MEGSSFLQATVASLVLLIVLHGSSSLCQAQSPPRLTQQPEKSIYYIKDSDPIEPVTLPCQAEGTQQINYQWKRNGERVSPSSDITIIAGQLMVLAPSEADVGNYTCFASNDFGTAVSNTAQVQMTYLRTFTDVVQDYPVDEGNSLKVPCEVPAGHPTPIVSWTDANDRPVISEGSWDPNRNLVNDGEGNLVFLQASLSDSDVYRCSASVSAIPEYKTFSARKTVSVVREQGESTERSPMILEGARDVSAMRGDDVKMYCLASGNPLPTITWTTLQNQDFSAQGPVLSLHNVQLYQDGVYTCTASSSLGQDVADVTLRVKAAPFWNAKPSDTTIQKGERVSLTCKAGGEPTPDIKWMVNGEHQPEYDGGSPVLGMVTGLKVYQCVASNHHGHIIANAIVNVTEALLLAPSDVVVTRDGPDGMTVKWSLLTSEDVSGYKVLYWPVGESKNEAQFRQVSQNTDSITIDSLEKDTTYYVSVKGYTSAGDGLASEPAVAKPAQGKVSAESVASTITRSVLVLLLTIIATFYLI